MSKAEFLHQVANDLPSEAFWPEEAVALLFGRLETGRRAARKAHLLLLMDRARVYSIPPRLSQSADLLPQPTETLSHLNRSRVFPPLLEAEATLPTAQLSRILTIIRSRHETGEPWPDLLDLLVTSSGISWENATEILAQTIRRSIDPADVEAVRWARRFWQFYAEGRARYQTLATIVKIPSTRGDCAYFDRADLRVLLPGVILADHHDRCDYLTGYDADSACLDVYSLTGVPLFRHPFLEKFNPLVFGKPRHNFGPGLN
jgi:hypothetical protein